MNQSKQSLYCTAIIRALDLHSGGLKIKQVFFFIYENFLIFFFLKQVLWQIARQRRATKNVLCCQLNYLTLLIKSGIGI